MAKKKNWVIWRANSSNCMKARPDTSLLSRINGVGNVMGSDDKITLETLEIECVTNQPTDRPQTDRHSGAKSRMNVIRGNEVIKNAAKGGKIYNVAENHPLTQSLGRISDN